MEPTLLHAHCVQKLIDCVATACSVPDPRRQIQLAVTSLAALLDADSSNATLVQGAGPSLAITDVIEGAPWPKEGRDSYMAYLRDEQGADPFFAALAERVGQPGWRSLVFARAELVADELWYASVHYRRYRSVSGFDASIYSVLRVTPEKMAGFSLHRRIGKPQFSPDEVACVRALLEGMHAVFVRLVNAPQGAAMLLSALPPRERTIAVALAQGHTAKHIAQQQGLSVATVQTYTKSVYRSLGVSGRGELFALFQSAGLTLPELNTLAAPGA